jgi:medium-chain acyl-[acyl-carrier-protein] hydrolase
MIAGRSDADAWIVRARPRLAPRLRLFCVPHGGGSAAVFGSWSRHLGQAVEVCAVELPGRKRRSAEPPFVRMGPLVDELESVMQRYFDTPFALFGTCTGALVAFELARRLAASGYEPAHLFVACSRAPQLPYPDRLRHALPDEELVGELGRMGGTSPEIIGHPELLALLLPTLRADFELAETYAYAPGPTLTVPISAFAGRDDPLVAAEQVEAWREQTASDFSFDVVPGDHHLVESQPGPLLALMADGLVGAGSTALHT